MSSLYKMREIYLWRCRAYLSVRPVGNQPISINRNARIWKRTLHFTKAIDTPLAQHVFLAWCSLKRRNKLMR